MNKVDEKPDDWSDATIKEELQRWPSSGRTDIVAAEARGRAERQIAKQKEDRRHRTFILLLGLIMLLGSISVGWWYTAKRKASTSQPEIAGTPSATPLTNANLESAQMKVGTVEPGADFTRTEASIISNKDEILAVVKYDFYPSKFIRNNTALKNQGEMTATFSSLSGQLKNAWVVIFTTASLEGNVDYNLRLCRDRLYAVRDLMKNNAAIAARKYWGILAGEYKTNLQGVTPGQEEDQENIIAAQRGETWLSEQRRLIVITIQEKQHIPVQFSDQVPIIVARHLYEAGLLPKDYDHPDSKPFPLTGKANNPSLPQTRSNPQ